MEVVEERNSHSAFNVGDIHFRIKVGTHPCCGQLSDSDS